MPSACGEELVAFPTPRPIDQGPPRREARQRSRLHRLDAGALPPAVSRSAASAAGQKLDQRRKLFPSSRANRSAKPCSAATSMLGSAASKSIHVAIMASPSAAARSGPGRCCPRRARQRRCFGRAEIGPMADEQLGPWSRRQGLQSKLRQRERIVGSSRPGLWLESSSTSACGGSSSSLRKALAALRFISSAPSTITTRQPPSAGVSCRKPPMARASSTTISLRCRLRFGSKAALDDEQVGMAAGGDAAEHGMVGRDGERFGLRRRAEQPAGRRPRPAETREAIGQRRLADAARPGDQPGMRQPAGVEGRAAPLRPPRGRAARGSRAAAAFPAPRFRPPVPRNPLRSCRHLHQSAA